MANDLRDCPAAHDWGVGPVNTLRANSVASENEVEAKGFAGSKVVADNEEWLGSSTQRFVFRREVGASGPISPASPSLVARR
jgi:hypothetical protein